MSPVRSVGAVTRILDRDTEATMGALLRDAPPAPEPVVVALHGELDIATADGMAEYALSAARPGAPLILDVSQVTFCDCGGLSGLLRVARKAEELGCAIGLMAPRPGLVKLLRLSGVRHRLPILPVRPALTPPAGEIPGR